MKRKRKTLWISSRNQLVELFVCCKINNIFLEDEMQKKKHKHLGTFYM